MQVQTNHKTLLTLTCLTLLMAWVPECCDLVDTQGVHGTHRSALGCHVEKLQLTEETDLP